MKIALYARVSTAHQGQDPDTQLIPLRRFAEVRGFEVYKEYVDVASGVKEQRKELNELLLAAKQRKIDAILIWKLDRLGRSLKHLISLIEDFHALGIQLISYTESIDTTTPSGKLLFNVIGSIAGFERDLIRERVKAGMVKAKEKGQRLGRPQGSKFDYSSALELKSQGLSIREIAKKIGVSKTTIADYLSEKRYLKPQENLLIN